MTCFNPKYVQYKYVSAVPKKIHQEIVQQYQKDGNYNKYIKSMEENQKIRMDINFQTKKAFDPTKIGNGSMIIPCQKCLGCKLDKSSEWATRAIIETKQWKNNFFLTLTYNNETLPKNGSLCKKDVQDFLKRIREEYKGIQPREWKGKIEYPIRMYYCGEYGPRTLRPHYHLAIFNWRPPDLKIRAVQPNGIPIYTSEIIEKKWGKGYHLIEDLNYEAACYIARYTIKKIFNDKNEWAKSKGLAPEFIETSRKGGIGYQIEENEAEWAKMKRNMGIFTWTRKGIKLKKIPQYLKNKWKKENNIEYIQAADIIRKTQEEEIQRMLQNTSKTKLEYIQQQKELIISKTKNTIKRQKTA